MSKHLSKQRTLAATMLAAGALAVGTLGPAAATAGAQPLSQNTIRKECGQASGVYQWWGGGVSTCTYQDISGEWNRDYYVNGVYTRSD